MNFIKRAFYSTKAKKGRTLLLTFVFSAILIFILAGLTIQSASLKATENAKKSMGATVTLSTNMENAMKKSSSSSSDDSSDKSERPDPGSFSITPVDLDTVNTLAKLTNVSSYNISSSTSVNAKSFDAISSDDGEEDASSNASNKEGSSQRGPGGGGMQMMKMSSGDITIEGTNATDTVSNFTNGTAEITEGVGITEDDANTNKAVIETNLAEANDISVGDTIKVADSEDEDTAYKLKVVGIYKTSETADARSMRNAALNPYNAIYTSYTFANKVKGADYKDSADSAVYTLSDPEKMDTFVKDAKKAGLDTDTYSLRTNDQVYQQMIQPLENVESFAQKIVILVSVAGTVILALIVILTIRERKYEIGVLLSLGEKRTKIIGQFFAELLAVLVIALVISGVSGKFVGNIVGEQLLEQQTTTTASSPNNQGGPGQNGGPSGNRGQAPSGQGGPGNGGGAPSFSNFGASSAENAKQIEDLNITLSLKELVELGGFGLAISFLAVIIASIGVMRMQPKKILIS
ncbi:ABC transporter permease [Rummeliibacillus sp. TYF005]|uniref:ABC transporter permease n=1 Tax=Rummeliibacillus sp. TYF005 TaxID=2058214 RepID=UPI000F536CDC|nr:ABC transporter permease [Rummeliibacillus sp. TYF005]RPJ96866.1 ABC transporter permease [Rummeliibacillus sp. TYF005]